MLPVGMLRFRMFAIARGYRMPTTATRYAAIPSSNWPWTGRRRAAAISVPNPLPTCLLPPSFERENIAFVRQGPSARRHAPADHANVDFPLAEPGECPRG